jgi:hypothetical protein
MSSPNQSGTYPHGLSEGELSEYEERARSFLHPHQGRHQPAAPTDFESIAMPPPAARGAGPAIGNGGALGYAGLRVPPPGFLFLPPQMQFATQAAVGGVPLPHGSPFSVGHLGGPHGAASTNDQYASALGYGAVLPAGLDAQSQFAAITAASRGLAIPQTMVVPSTWLMQQQHQTQYIDPSPGLSFHLGVGTGLPASFLEAAYARDAQAQLALGFDRNRGPGAGLTSGDSRKEAPRDDDDQDDDEEERHAQAAERKEPGRPPRQIKKPARRKKKAVPPPSPSPEDDRRLPEPGLTGHAPVPLWNDYDETALTEYQCLLRKQIELFEATEEDLRGSAQGRNTPIRLGQVGIRCIHCSGMPKLARARGAVYYSRTVDGVYQVAQNMSKIHFVQTCQKISKGLRAKLATLQRVNNRASGGKEYWLDNLKALGIFDDGRCVRFRTFTSGPVNEDEEDATDSE